MQPVLEQLLIDEHIRYDAKHGVEDGRLYHLTFKGRKFNSDGGHEGATKRKNSETTRIETTAERKQKNDLLSFTSTDRSVFVNITP